MSSADTLERSLVRQLPTGAARVIWVAVFVATASPAAGQFVSQPTNTRHILEGNWQSCQESPGGPYAERVYDHVVNGVGLFEVHMGPRREFAIFPGVQDDHREHRSSENLLEPYRVLMEGTRAKHRWEVPSLNLAFTVTLGGGARTDCESWYILLEPLEKNSN
jgi:hypothetical protein